MPLLFPEAPIIGTGMEGRTAYDSGVVVKAKRPGTVSYVSSTRIEITPEEASEERDLRHSARTCGKSGTVVREDIGSEGE